jgi:hypothetical protein
MAVRTGSAVGSMSRIWAARISDQRDTGATNRFDVDDRQEDRQAASPGELEVEHRIAGMVIAVAVAGEAMIAADHLAAGKRHRPIVPRQTATPSPAGFRARQNGAGCGVSGC